MDECTKGQRALKSSMSLYRYCQTDTTASPLEPFTRFQIALLLSSYGTMYVPLTTVLRLEDSYSEVRDEIQGEAGDFSGASTSLLSLAHFLSNIAFDLTHMVPYAVA